MLVSCKSAFSDRQRFPGQSTHLQIVLAMCDAWTLSGFKIFSFVAPGQKQLFLEYWFFIIKG